MPYFERRLVRKDARVKGLPRLSRTTLAERKSAVVYFPGKEDGDYVVDYYENPYKNSDDLSPESSIKKGTKQESRHLNPSDAADQNTPPPTPLPLKKAKPSTRPCNLALVTQTQNHPGTTRALPSSLSPISQSPPLVGSGATPNLPSYKV